MNDVDAGMVYELAPSSRRTFETGVHDDITALTAEVQAIRKEQASASLDASVMQLGLGGLALAIVGVMVFSWLRSREVARVRALLDEQSVRLDAQDQRVTAAVGEMASERALQAAERARLHEAIDEVAGLGEQLKTDLAESVAIYGQVAREMASSQNTVLALIAQLQRAAQDLPNVQA